MCAVYFNQVDSSFIFLSFFFSFFAILGLELRAYTSRHSTSPIFVMGLFKIGSPKLFASNHDPPDLLGL
jgi:hypothetical protein